MKTFKIIKIINEYKVVVNAGANNDIKEDDILEVYAPGQEITDPETKEFLGTLDYIKAKLRVVDVFPKMCVCVNRETRLSEPFKELSNLTITQRVSLNVDSREISGGYENVDKKIHLGDLVRLVTI